MTTDAIYLDNNASTPLDPRVLDVVVRELRDGHGNPSSAHHEYGRRAAAALADARQRVRTVLCAPDYDVVFTSCATESLNLALLGLRPDRAIVGATEHKAVLEVCRWLQHDAGTDVVRTPVDSSGVVALDALEEALRTPTSLIALQVANGEVGTIQPLRDVVALAARCGVPVLSDASQAIGRIPVSLDALPVDLLVLSSHKIYGPPGVGAILLRRRTMAGRLRPIMFGGGQESGLRPGTENVAEILGFAEALELAVKEQATDARSLRAQRDDFERRLLAAVDGIAIHARHADRLPNTSSFSVRSPAVATILRRATGIAVSTGSACESHDPAPSHVLRAMGVDEALASNAVRVSFGRFSPAGSAAVAAAELSAAINRSG